MADIADKSQKHEEMWLTENLSKRKQEGPEETGYCLFCGEKTKPGWRWCNAECRDNWEAENA